MRGGINGYAFGFDFLSELRIERASRADDVKLVDDRGFIECIGEFQPLIGAGAGCCDGEINVRGAAGVAGGAGAEEADFTHAREAVKDAAEHGEITVAEGDFFHAFVPISGFEFYLSSIQVTDEFVIKLRSLSQQSTQRSVPLCRDFLEINLSAVLWVFGF